MNAKIVTGRKRETPFLCDCDTFDAIYLVMMKMLNYTNTIRPYSESKKSVERKRLNIVLKVSKINAAKQRIYTVIASQVHSN